MTFKPLTVRGRIGMGDTLKNQFSKIKAVVLKRAPEMNSKIAHVSSIEELTPEVRKYLAAILSDEIQELVESGTTGRHIAEIQELIQALDR